MKTRLFCILAGACGIGVASASVTITSYDMFHEVGQWYRVYANSGPVSVSGRLGTAGPDQVWDFTFGPQNKVRRFDYVPVHEEGYGVHFPEAKFAERMTDESTGSARYLYLDQIPGTGRRNFGYYDPNLMPIDDEDRAELDSPMGVFQPPIVDFPESIRYGDNWSVASEWYTTVMGFPAKALRTATAKADASGLINLPGLGFDEGVRINYLAHWSLQVEIPSFDPEDPDGVEILPISFYNRTYYWLRKNHGIVVTISSSDQYTTSPPPDDFPMASEFTRQFELSRPTGSPAPQPVTGLRMERGTGSSSNRWLLTWEKGFNASSYRVEWTQNPGDPVSWQTLTTTTQTWVLTDHVPGPENRFFRIVSIE
jgi:hypothetical protein